MTDKNQAWYEDFYGNDYLEALGPSLTNTAKEAEFIAVTLGLKAGDQILSSLTDRLLEIGEQKAKVDAVELCYNVMTADGVIDVSETELVNKIGEAVGLDDKTMEIIRDGAMLGKDIEVHEQSSIESLLNIDSSWPTSKVKKHLGVEFAKWNGRLNTLPEGPDRDHAQYMLDVISEARTKYGI